MSYLIPFNVGDDTNTPTDKTAEKLGLSSWKVRESRSSGVLLGRPASPFVRRGRNIYYKEADIEAFLADVISNEFSTTADYAGV